MPANPYVFLGDCLLCEALGGTQLGCANKPGTPSWPVAAFGTPAIMDCFMNIAAMFEDEFFGSATAYPYTWISIAVALIEELAIANAPGGKCTPRACKDVFNAS